MAERSGYASKNALRATSPYDDPVLHSYAPYFDPRACANSYIIDEYIDRLGCLPLELRRDALYSWEWTKRHLVEGGGQCVPQLRKWDDHGRWKRRRHPLGARQGMVEATLIKMDLIRDGVDLPPGVYD